VTLNFKDVSNILCSEGQ